jgi:hypothetical protein
VPRPLPASTSAPPKPPVSHPKSSRIRPTNFCNNIVTGYVPEGLDLQNYVDLLIYDVSSKITDEQLVLAFKSWGNLVSISKRMQRKYMTLRVRISLNQNYAVFYHRHDWSVMLGGTLVRWFPASWSLSERKKRERFQAVIHNIPDSMTMASLMTNGSVSSLLSSVGARAFKIIQLADKSRKLVGYFDTWNAVQQARACTPSWCDVKLEWKRHFSPSYNRKPQSTSTKVSTGRTPNAPRSRASGANAIPVSHSRSNTSKNKKTPIEESRVPGPKKSYAAAASHTSSKANTDLKKILLKLLATL